MSIKFKIILSLIFFSSINYSQVEIVIPAGMEINMASGQTMVGVIEIIEEVPGSFNGTAEPATLNNVLEYGGLTFSQPFSGTITRNTQTAYSSSNPKSTLRSYELNNSGAQITTNLHSYFDLNTESNNISDRFIFTVIGGVWQGYSDFESTPSSIGAENVVIPVGLSNIVISEGVGISPKIFLEGPYQGGTVPLTNSLAIPQNSPYTVATRSSSLIPANAVDWVLVELRSGTASSSVVARRSAFVDVNGNIVSDEGNIGIGLATLPSSTSLTNYYIVIKHRNHLPVMSSTALALDWFSNN